MPDGLNIPQQAWFCIIFSNPKAEVVGRKEQASSTFGRLRCSLRFPSAPAADLGLGAGMG